MSSNEDREAHQIAQRTEEIEQERAERKAEREARKLERERKTRNVFLEKLVAPIILIATILISLLLLSGRR